MGAGASSLTGTLNRAELLKATQSPRFLMDKILEYMLTQINEKDVFKMSDQRTCSQFLILSAGALDQLFRQLDVQPSTDKSGKLYFKKVTELTQPPQGTDERRERDTNCTAIAYFYIRILQIYIALAYTILDDPRIMPGSSFRLTERAVARPIGALGTPGRRLVYLGGALTEIEGELPKKIVVGGQILGPSTWTLDRLRTAGVFTSEAGALKLSGRPDISIRSNGSKEAILSFKRARPEMQFGGPWGYMPQPQRFGALGTSLTIKLGQEGENRRPRINLVNYTTNDGDRRPLTNYWIAVDETDLSQGRGRKESSGFQDISTLLAEIMDAIENDNFTKLEEFKHSTRAEKALGDIGIARNIYGRPVARSGLSSPSGPPGLQFGKTLDYLQPSTVRPLAHCIARSFQLLNIDALAGAPAKSYICSTTFKGVPDAVLPGSKIIAIKGLQAFEFLYFILRKSPGLGNLVGLTSQTKDAYNVALKYMFTKFGNPGTAPVATETAVPGERGPFKDVKSAPIARCGSTTSEIQLDRAQTAVAKQGVAQLWGYQRAHAAKVEKLFMKLFDIGRQRDGSLGIKISEYLFKGGIPAVEQVAAEARILLGEYYGKCEEIYRTAASKL